MIAVIITCLYSVENLSTGNVEKSQSHRYFVDSVENLSTGDVENHYKEGLSSKVKRNNVESVDKIC